MPNTDWTNGQRGDVKEPATEYFTIVLIGVPFLAWAMMSNNVIRAEGFPRIAMLTIMIPAVVNIILDPIFIIWLDMGLAGAAWATTISYISSAAFATWFFLRGDSQMKLTKEYLKPDLPIIRETIALGSVTFAPSPFCVLPSAFSLFPHFHAPNFFRIVRNRTI